MGQLAAGQAGHVPTYGQCRNKEDGARRLTTFVAYLPDKLVKPAEVRGQA